MSANLDKITDVLVNWQALLLAFSAFAILGTIRAMGTRKDKDGKIIGGWAENKHFHAALPIIPYVITVGVVFIPGMPLPELVKGVAVKVLFGIWAGWLSDKSFQVIQTILKKSFGMKFGADQ
jgi:hypothetical protein